MNKSAKHYIKVIVFSGVQCIIVPLLFFLLPIRWIRKLHSNKKNSLWASTPIINMGINARAERLLGINSKSLVYHTYYITNAFDYNLAKLFSLPVLGRFIPYGVFLWAFVTIDRFHFYCDQGLLPSLRPFTFNFFELLVYRLLKVELFCWTYGADVRSRAITKKLLEPNCCSECTLVNLACICDQQAQQKNMHRLYKYTNAIFAMGDMTEYTFESYNDLFFWPIDLSNKNKYRYQPIYPEYDPNKPLRIVHAPNHRMFKGTRFLIAAIAKLQTQGFDIELVLVEKVPNDKALGIYRSADIIFDQCLIGFHGYFALEGMAMGKPVMCYIKKNQYLLEPQECPIIQIHIHTLERDIKWALENRKQLTEIGIRSRNYIEKYFTLEAFSQRLHKAYQKIL